MDDLQALRAALAADDPSQDVVDRSRHLLQNRVRGGRASRKRAGWLTVGVGLTVTAAAAALAFSTLPAPPGGPATALGTGTPTESPPAAAVSAPEILLAAATSAGRSPEGSGAYWHVTARFAGERARVDEYWINPDGRAWFRGVRTGGKVVPMGERRPKPFPLVAVDLSLEELRALPTDPGALKSWIAEAVEHADARTSAGGRLSAVGRAEATFYSLIALVSTVPAPPEVRAAAFRAIASYPDVESTGAVPGGQGLELPRGERLVVDPATGRVNGTSMFITFDSRVYATADLGGAGVDAEWTDTLPE
ncbi:CU044_5270 family protein [Actinosynnema sp. NPDC023794]